MLNLLKDDEYFQFLQERSPLSAKVDETPAEAKWSGQIDPILDALAALGSQATELKIKPPASLSEADKQKLQETEAKIAHKQQEMQATEAQIEQESQKIVAAPPSAPPDGQALRDALAKAGDGTAAIYTLVTDKGVRLMMNTLNHEPITAFRAIARKDLNQKVLAFRRALEDPRLDPRPLGGELYALLVQPLLPQLKAGAIKTILWSLDGTLRYIPIWALYDGDAGEYLTEKYGCALFTPRSLSGITQSEEGGPWKGVEMGVSKGGKVGETTFPVLSSVVGELHAVHEVLGGDLLLNDTLTKAAFQREIAKPFSVCHLATHFRLVEGDPAKSYLLLGGNQSFSIQDFKALKDGALEHFRLIVFSACETGVGQANADGSEFESLGLLAQMKGARAVIASLWPVEDQGVSQFMATFYRLHRDHPNWTKIHCIQEVQRQMLAGLSAIPSRGVVSQIGSHSGKALSGYRHPFYWAPFALFGDWR